MNVGPFFDWLTHTTPYGGTTVPQASDALRDLMEKKFGSLGDDGPREYLTAQGYTLDLAWNWFHPTVKTYKAMSRVDFDCLLFLTHEWDYGFLLGADGLPAKS